MMAITSSLNMSTRVMTRQLSVGEVRFERK
jgi:hypothetical protein